MPLREVARTLSLDKRIQLHTVLLFSQSCPTLCDPLDCSRPGFPISRSLLKFMSIESGMPSNHLILYCHLLPSLIFPSIRIFSNELGLCIRQPKYWSFSFSISPSNEYSGLTSLRIDWFDLLAIQGTRRSLLQHHSSKASVLWRLPSLRSSSHNRT